LVSDLRGNGGGPRRKIPIHGPSSIALLGIGLATLIRDRL